jgi:hypothetical protein
MATLPAFSSDTYTLQLQARKTNGNEGFFIYYGLDERGRNGYVANIAGWNNMTTAFQPVVRGRTNDVIGRQVHQKVENDRWYDIKLVVTPELVTLFVDGQEITSAKPAAQPRYFCQTGYDDMTGELIIKVVNGTEQPYTRSFSIKGAQNIASEGRVITLSGNPQDENTFDNPTKLTPKTTTFSQFSENFQYEFAPMSYTIMRVKARSPQPRRRRMAMENKHPGVHDPVMARGEDGKYYIIPEKANMAKAKYRGKDISIVYVSLIIATLLVICLLLTFAFPDLLESLSNKFSSTIRGN